MAQCSSDRGGHCGFGGGADQDYVGVDLRKDGVEGFCETVRRPALGRTVGGSGAYGYAESVGTDTGFA
jgi:hypothetical protein